MPGAATSPPRVARRTRTGTGPRGDIRRRPMGYGEQASRIRAACSNWVHASIPRSGGARPGPRPAGPRGWPELGRPARRPGGGFVQRDPAKEGMNWYAYVGNRPTMEVDAEGRAYQCASCLGCVSTVVGYVVGGCSAGCWNAPMGFSNCVTGCLQEVMTCAWWEDLPIYTQIGLGICASMCIGCLPELAGLTGGKCDQTEECPSVPDPPPPDIWTPGQPLPPDLPVSGWP